MIYLVALFLLRMYQDTSLTVNCVQSLPSARYIFTALFTMVVVVVMLNLLVSLLNDLYEELKSLATADWCRAQVPAANEAPT